MSRKLLMYNKAKIVYIKNTTNAGFFKVGVGDDVDYSDEVNDGISTLALKGNTKVVDVDGNEVSIGTTGGKLVSVGDLWDDGKYRIEIVSCGKNLYEPYKTHILLNKPLMSTPTKQDVLEEDGTITRECNSYTITGDENWVVRQTFTNHILYNCSYVPLNSFRDYKNSDKKMKCDALPCFNGDGEDEEFIICRANGDGFVIGLNKSKASNLTEFKAWLKQTKVNVVYERYTKTTEKINPVNIGIFKGGHVSINTTVAPSESIHSVNLK
ncbi:hypothetical protein [uncultured Clostridium sp.]|uniref:hypothetical protein n=1 Tax=uncultured Clostridium sp. TaxID=59620 RepID=UPI0025D04995|nr:hypothetical protein [uncultured Clostridium sp.]